MDQALSPEQDKVPPTPPNSPSRRRKRHHERSRSNRHGAGRSGSDHALLLPPPPGLSAEIDSPDVDGPPAVRFYPTVPGGSNGIPIGSLVAAVTGNYIVYGADQVLRLTLLHFFSVKENVVTSNQSITKNTVERACRMSFTGLRGAKNLCKHKLI